MIDMNKKYTSDGRPVRLLCTDANGTHPVVALHDTGVPMSFKSDGTCTNSRLNLIEVSPYADFKVDEPVMVRDDFDKTWVKGYFAGVDADTGKPTRWWDGRTSWIATDKSSRTKWDQCRRPTAEELAS